MFNKHDISRDECQLYGKQAKLGYDWWWHSFTGTNIKTKERKSFFIEFYLCNPSSGKEYPILGQLDENKANKIKPSYLMIKAGAWGKNAKQLHKFFGWKEIEVKYKKPFYIKADGFFLDELSTIGSIKIDAEEIKNHPEYMCQSGEMSWNLKIKKDIAFNVGYGAGKLFRKMQLFEMFWHAEGMKSYFEGTVTIDGEEYEIKNEDSYGYADKNWGKDFTSPWVWLSSNNLTSLNTGKKLENSVFDIGGGCPKIGKIALNRKLLSAFYYEGKCYEFNFSKFWHNVKTTFDCHETEDEIIWHVEQKTWSNKMITDIKCKKEDMLLINYEAPNGSRLHRRLWNGGNGVGTIKLYHNKKLIDEIYCENVGCEFGQYNTLKKRHPVR